LQGDPLALEAVEGAAGNEARYGRLQVGAAIVGELGRSLGVVLGKKKKRRKHRHNHVRGYMG
jgi:hypothetical protein